MAQKAKKHYNGEKPERTPSPKFKQVSSIVKELKSELEISRLGAKLMSGGDDFVYRFKPFKPKKNVNINAAGDSVLSYFIDAFNMKPNAPKEQSGAQLMYKTIEYDNYVPMQTTFRRNLSSVQKSFQRAMTANEIISFDFETLSGANASGKQEFDFITEVSFRHYSGLGMDSVDKLLKQGDTLSGVHSFNALIGLSSSDKTKVETLLDSFLSGKAKFNELTNKQQVYIQELAKFSNAVIDDTTGLPFKRIKSKMSSEELERLLLRPQDELIDSVRKGIDFLASNYDPNTLQDVKSRIQGAVDYVDNNSNAILLTANGLNFDVPLIRKMFNIDVNNDNVMDITELYQSYHGITGNVKHGGSQLSTLYDSVLGKSEITSDGASVAHVADFDTHMAARVFVDPKTKRAVENMLKYTDKHAQKLSPGHVYNIDSSLMSNLGARVTKNSIIGSTGYYYDNATGEIINRNFSYDAAIDTTTPYILTDMREIDFDSLPDHVKENYKKFKDDSVGSTKKIHMLKFSPFNYQEIDRNPISFSTSAEMDTVLFLSDDEYQKKIGGIGHSIGTMPLVENDNGTHSVDYSNPQNFGLDLKIQSNTPLTQDQQARKVRARTELHAHESAMRKYEENPAKMYMSFKHLGLDKCLELSTAITSRDTEKIKVLSDELNDSIRDIILNKPFGYHSTAEAYGHALYLSDDLIRKTPAFSAAIEVMKGRGFDVDKILGSGADGVASGDYAVLDTFYSTVNSMIKAIDSATKIEQTKSKYKRRLSGTATKNKLVDLPWHQRKLSIDLSNKIVPAYKKTRSFSIDFGNQFSSYKLADRLLEISDINTTGLSDTTIESIKKKLLNTYVQDVVKDEYVGKHAAEAFLKKGSEIINTRGELIGFDDPSITSEELSSKIFYALRNNKVTSKKRPVRNIIGGVLSGSSVTKINGKTITNNTDYKNAAMEIAQMVPTVRNVSIHGKNIADGAYDPIFNALIDPSARDVSSYYKHLTDTVGFDSTTADVRAGLFGEALREYKSSVRDFVKTYSDKGMEFAVHDGILYAKDSTSDYVKLNVPRLRIANNGTAYIEYGRKNVGISYGSGFKKGTIGTTFSDAAGFWRSSARSIERKGGVANIATLMSDIAYKYSGIGDSSDVTALTSSHLFTSGGLFNVTDIGIHLFGDDSYDQVGALNTLKTNNPALYQKLKTLYEDGTKYKSPDNIVGVSVAYQEAFYQNLTSIASSVADWADDAVGDPLFAKTLRALSVSESQEKPLVQGKVQIGRHATSFETYGYKRHRPTGVQTSKGQQIRVDKLKEAGFTNIHNIIETDQSEKFSVQHNIGGIEGLDTTNGFYVKTARMNQTEFIEKLNSALDGDNKAALKEKVEAKYGKGSFDIIMRTISNANVDNDGSIILDDVARVMPSDIVNNKYIDVAERFNGSIVTASGTSTIVSKYLPDIEIDPQTKAIRVKFNEDFFVGGGSKFHSIDDGIEYEALIKHQSNARFGFFNNYIELTEDQINSAISHIDNAYEKLSQGTTKEGQLKILSDMLSSSGIRFQLLFENAALHNKVGFGEEKTFTNSLSLSIDALAQSKAILKKYNFYQGQYQELSGTVINDRTFDAIVKHYNISAEDADILYRNMGAPTEIARQVLDLSKDVSMITNVNNTKHQSSSQLISNMLMTMKLSKKYTENPKEFGSLIKRVYGDSAKYDGEYIHYSGDFEKANIELLTSEYKSMVEDYNKKKAIDSSYYDPALDDVDNTVWERIVPMNDWEGKKYAGKQNLKRINYIEKAREGEIPSTMIQKELRNLDDFSDEKVGSLFGRLEYNILNRYKITPDAMSGIITALDDDDDIVLNKYRQYYLDKGILELSDGKYGLSKRAAMGTTGFLEETLSGFRRAMTQGQSHELKLSDYAEGDFEPTDEWHKNLINRYFNDRDLYDKYANYSMDKIEAIDAVERYKGVRKFNYDESKRTHLDLSGENVIKASEIEVTGHGIGRMVANAPNNIYTNDSVIDLGEDFKENRYIKTLGLRPRFRDGDEYVSASYQQHFGRLRELSEAYRYISENGTLPDETLKSLHYDAYDIETIKSKLKENIETTARNILSDQEKYVLGKQSLSTNLASFRAQISASLESQTLTPIDGYKNLSEFDITKNFKFEGMSLQEHKKRGRLIDYAVISERSAEEMGFFNKRFMESQNVSSRAEMLKLLKTKGVTGFVDRQPHVFGESVTTAQMYVSDTIDDESILLNRYTQDKMKNDNDSDKPSLSIYDLDAMNQNEIHAQMIAQSYKNSNMGAEPKKNALRNMEDMLAIVSNNTIFGNQYANIQSVEEYNEVFDSVHDGKYADAYSEIINDLDSEISAAETAPSYLEQQSMFDAKLKDYAASHKVDSDFVDDMHTRYVNQMRLNRHDLAVAVNTTKERIGFVNNATREMVNIGVSYVDNMLSRENIGDADRTKLIAARELMRDTEGKLIEDVINIKNTVNMNVLDRSSRYIDSIKGVLYGKSGADRADARDNLSNLIEEVAGERIEEYINAADPGSSSVLDYLASQNISRSDTREAVHAMSQLMADTYYATDSTKNKQFRDAMHIGYSDSTSGQYAPSFNDIIVDPSEYYGNMMSSESAYEATQEASEQVHFTHSVGDDYITGSNVDFGSTATSGKGAQYIKNAINNALSNMTGKRLALGAVGLAAGLMAVGYIGGNPTSAPQDDANQFAYEEDNFDYSTGYAMLPPQPQIHNNGYVINMKGSTNGSYSQARGQMVQAVQQNYMPNMNVNIRQNFSYSSYENNDRYVENLIRELM